MSAAIDSIRGRLAALFFWFVVAGALSAIVADALGI